MNLFHIEGKYLGAFSLKHFGFKVALQLVYFVLKKVLQNFSEIVPGCVFVCVCVCVCVFIEDLK